MLIEIYNCQVSLDMLRGCVRDQLVDGRFFHRFLAFAISLSFPGPSLVSLLVVFPSCIRRMLVIDLESFTGQTNCGFTVQ